MSLKLVNLSTKKIITLKSKMLKIKKPNITNLATTAALTAVKNKIPNVSNLVKKADYAEKIKEIES